MSLSAGQSRKFRATVDYSDDPHESFGFAGSSKSIRDQGRQCQLAQLCGESPLASRRVLSAPASRRNLTVSSEA
jgi:hypothetical protein